MQDVNEDTDDMYEDLINKYGKVVFSRKDQKPASAEIDDDAESLSCKLEGSFVRIFFHLVYIYVQSVFQPFGLYQVSLRRFVCQII